MKISLTWERKQSPKFMKNREYHTGQTQTVTDQGMLQLKWQKLKLKGEH